jgi:hypothetical protein
MNYHFLLDTSAFRSLSGKILNQLSIQGQKIYVSPYCFWELLCHLEEKGEFERFKSHLLKFDFVQILDDPRALFENPILINDNELVDRISDQELINDLLNALEKSSTLCEFYSFFIKDSKGQIRLISKCSKRVSDILAKEEERYKEFIKNIIGAIKSGHVKVDNINDHHERILELVNGKKIDLLNRGADENGLINEIINGTYIYYAYIFYRVLKYYKNPNSNIDKNDYEDAYICLHIKLNTTYCLVTADTGMAQALNETISLINQLKDRKINTTFRVEDVEFLKKLCIN